jgi:hypothetical protein
MHPVNMKSIAGMTKVILGEHQPEYTPLPALRDAEKVLTEWLLSAEDLRLLAAGGRIRLWQWTGHGAYFQPMAAEVVALEDVLPLEATS